MSSTSLIQSIKSDLATIPKGVDDDTRAVAGGSGFNKRISIKGSVFRKFSGGKEIGTVEDRHMNVVFVKMAHEASRTYYEGAYKEGSKAGPVCWSSNAKFPDPEVKNPVSKSCDGCSNSIKGSGLQGTGSACRLSWRTAVVLPSDPGGDIMQLVLPATSVFGKGDDSGRWPFRSYIQMLASNNISAGRVITKMQFDTAAAVPTLKFSPVSAVPPEDMDIIQEQGKNPAAEAAIKLTVFQQDESGSPAAAEVKAPEQESETAEPVLVKATKTEPVKEDVADIVKKWSKK